ncbi:MAG: BlaI/MecI/CopY family transcriptional regulator [Bacteroidales bacterium]|nr:MAG: BlaI/MecI/CopY family transcriptional regulator [Bacteroidales bacterium]
MKDKKNNIQRLTRAEEQVMQILWDLNEAVVKDLVDHFHDPKPAYTTVATVLKVLEKKGFVTYRKIGNTHLYSHAIGKAEYSKFQLSNLLVNYFNGSYPKMATFFARMNDLSIRELEEMITQTEEELEKEKTEMK